MTLRALAGARGIPGPLLPLAVRAAQGRTGLHGDRLDTAAHPDTLKVPTLVMHGPDDEIAPWALSRELAARRPDLVTLHTVGNAPHGAMWNADPHTYEETLRRFLTPSCSSAAAPADPPEPPAYRTGQMRRKARVDPRRAPVRGSSRDARKEPRNHSVWVFGPSTGRLPP